MNYFKHYNLLIQKCQTRHLDSSTYVEKHHILPRCMDGSNDKSNLVDMLPREHFIAHRLLAKMYPEVSGLLFALLRMKQNCTSSHTYQTIRTQCSLNRKGKNKTNSEMYKKVSEAQLGRTMHNYPPLEQMAQKKRGRTAATCPGIASMVQKVTGRTKETHEYLRLKGEKISKIQKGQT
jgi:hypothetical protein